MWVYGNDEVGLVKSYDNKNITYTVNTVEAMKFATKSDLMEARLEIERINKQKIKHRAFFDLKNLQDYFDFLANIERNAGKIYEPVPADKINLLYNLAAECGLKVKRLYANAYWLGCVYDDKIVDCRREYYGNIDECIAHLRFRLS